MNPKLSLYAVLFGVLAVSQPCRVYVVSGDSMSPTLHSGEVIVGNARPHRIARGDVVVFRRDGETMVKRVAFLAGDRVERYRFMDEWTVPLTPLSRGAMMRRRLPRKDFVVPTGSFYALGDNLPSSVDSRTYGAVPLGDVLAVLPPQSTADAPKIVGHLNFELVARL